MNAGYVRHLDEIAGGLANPAACDRMARPMETVSTD
jgi:hypothetical protein